MSKILVLNDKFEKASEIELPAVRSLGDKRAAAAREPALLEQTFG